MKKGLTRLLAAGLAALTAVSLTACGGKDAESALTAQEEPSRTSQTAQKEELVLGVMLLSQDLRDAVAAFNKSNQKYHVTIREYLDFDNGIYTDTAVTNLNNELISGNGPDILMLDGRVDEGLLAEKGFLADLNPFLESSSLLSRDSFVESVLRCNTYGDMLACLPKYFSISTVAGKTSQVGEEMGWTVQDIMELSAENPGAELFEGFSRAGIMQVLMNFNRDAFIDWENGACHFDSQEFRRMLEFVAGFPEEEDFDYWSAEREPVPFKLAAGRLLLFTDAMSRCYDIQITEAMFNEPVTYIGYPTADGSVGCVMSFEDGCSMVERSGHKDGAWEFIEYYLTASGSMDEFLRVFNFPSLKEAMEEKIAEECKVIYMTDENSEIMRDEEGNPLVNSFAGLSYGEDWTYDCHPCTEEELAVMWELIDAARPVPGGSREILMIISEEAEAFYRGQKSLDEVVAVIQSRASMYVGENS